jgi:hypothetical protein
MERKHDNLEPVFRLKPEYKSNVCELKLVGYMDPEQRLGDEVIDIETSEDVVSLHGKNVDFLFNLDGYNITACIYKNNILGNFILKNDFLPVYSISVAYTKTLVDGFLFDIFIGFELNQESRDLIKNPKKCYNARLYGQFKLKLYCDDQVIEDFEKVLNLIEEYTVSDSLILDKMNNMSEEDFSNLLLNEIQKRKDFMLELKDGKILDGLYGVNKTATMLRNIYKNNNLKPLIKVALDARQEERRKKYNAVDKYEIPQKVLNIKDVEQNPDMLDKYLGINN